MQGELGRSGLFGGQGLASWAVWGLKMSPLFCLNVKMAENENIAVFKTEIDQLFFYANYAKMYTSS